MENDLLTLFNNRIQNWKNKEIIPQDFPYPDFTEVKCPTENKSQIANRFATAKGIPSRDRYNFLERTREVLMKMIPYDKQLAREIADKWEKDIFDNSSNYTIYTKETKAKYTEVKMNLEMQKNLPKI